MSSFWRTTKPLPLVGEFTALSNEISEVLELAFRIGQKNPFAESLFEESSDGTYTVSDELRGDVVFEDTFLSMAESTYDFVTNLSVTCERVVELESEDREKSFARIQAELESKIRNLETLLEQKHQECLALKSMHGAGQKQTGVALPMQPLSIAVALALSSKLRCQ